MLYRTGDIVLPYTITRTQVETGVDLIKHYDKHPYSFMGEVCLLPMSRGIFTCTSIGEDDLHAQTWRYNGETFPACMRGDAAARRSCVSRV